MRFFKTLTDYFPLWVLAGAGLALWHPPLFTWFSGSFITLGLAVIMLGMGVTLTVEDFQRVIAMPGSVALGVVLQYTIMPFLGWSVSAVLGLSPEFAVGLILVACCPGGTASNVVSYLAGANVPLSVTMTACSTLLAAVMTPLLTALLAGSRIDVNAWGLFRDTVGVVVLPVTIGLLMNRYAVKWTQKILPAAPFAAVVFITLIVSSIVGSGREIILKSGFLILLSVLLLHGFGFLVGYVLSKIVTHNEITARTISIEVGMQNSGLGVVLARQNFHHPAVAIPSAISSLVHCLMGSLLASIWRRRPPKNLTY